VSAYARPASLDEALGLLARPGARALAGGTDLAGQIDRGIADPALLVDLQATGLDSIASADGAVVVGAAVTVAAVADAPELAPYDAIGASARQAASPLLRNAGTVGGNLCQGTRCWYFRGAEWNCWLKGGDTCYAQIGDHRKHGLEPGDCISAHPSDLAPALAACRATVVVRSESGTRELSLPDLYRRPTGDDRALVVLDPGELITEVRLPPPPDRSTYLRVGERQAFSFPLVSVAAARFGDEIELFANGVANVPRRLDPDDPLAGLPGNPQSEWKRRLLAELAARALSAVR
jgi:CO/xanthine dehydrogenase FAD-binding subunit